MPADLLQSLDWTTFAGVAALVAGLGVVAWYRWTRDRAATAREASRAERAALREQDAMRGSLEDLLTRLEEFAAGVETRVERAAARLDERLRRAERAAEAAPPVAGSPRLAHSATAPQIRIAPPGEPRAGVPWREEARALFAAGHGPWHVAQALRVPVGEVELVYHLDRAARAPQRQAAEPVARPRISVA